jgi:Cu(I)/Ag(I) efflux system membrane fusion protein
VRIEITNTDGHLRPGLLATGLVRAHLAANEPPLVIPATAPLHTGRRAVVYVQDPDAERPTFEARTITLGPRLGELYVVSKGLTEGDLVVVNGQFKIDSELQIRGRPSMMSAAAAETDAPAEADPRDPPAVVVLTAPVDATFSDELIPLLNAYLDLGERLADEDRAGARAAANKLRATLDAIGEHRLTGDAHMAWMDHYQMLDTPLAALPDAPSIADLRAQLQAMTTALEAIYVTFGGGRLPPVLRAHCPMVDGGVVINGEPIGTWLQRTDLLANPYWGEVMLRCGDFHGELK